MAEYKEICCKDVGAECDFTVRAETVQEVLEKCAEHAASEHGWKGFREDLYLKMRQHIRTVQA